MIHLSTVVVEKIYQCRGNSREKRRCLLSLPLTREGSGIYMSTRNNKRLRHLQRINADNPLYL